VATATLKLSGYLAVAAAFAWASGQSLNSLTDNEYTDVADEIDNSTNRYAFADFYVSMASAAFTGTDSGIEVYLVPAVDGTTYPTWTGNGTADEPENGSFYVGFIPFTGTTAAQYGVLTRIPLPNGRWKPAFRNRGNVTTAASGNTAGWRPHSFDSVS
jgi:hypothetical protein